MTMPTPQRLFVYGTLRRRMDHPMAMYLAQHATLVGGGTVAGELYDLGRYPGLLIPNGCGDAVRGDVYALNPSSAALVLDALDRYEGCRDSDPQPHEYERRALTVHLDTGAVIEAWSYALTRLPPGSVRIDGGDYLADRRRKYAVPTLLLQG